MPHFQMHAHKGRYRWLSAKTGKVVVIIVRYSKGGLNYYNYKIGPRGIYIDVNVMNIEDRNNGFVTEQYVPSAGRSFFVQAMDRLSEKKLLEVINRLEIHVDDIAKMLLVGDMTAVHERISHIFEKERV